ncbi:MAG: GerMN domain-containing protein [bacterium]
MTRNSFLVFLGGIVLIIFGYFLIREYIPAKTVVITDFSSCVAAGNVVLESYPRQCRMTNGTMFKETIQPSENPNESIHVVSPASGSTVKSPVRISGEARGVWFFEGSFPIEIKDGSGKTIGQGIARADGEWMTSNFVPFTAEVAYSDAANGGEVVLMRDNPSGLPENDQQVRVPVILQGSKTLSVNVYFSNLNKNPGAADCTLVYPVGRESPETQAVARVAILQLLEGPSVNEKVNGYETTINPGVKLQKLTIVDGVAKVDFDAALEKGVGGSCRTAFIRSQIEKTLLQFPTVKSVVISIDGKSEDILQP